MTSRSSSHHSIDEQRTLFSIFSMSIRSISNSTATLNGYALREWWSQSSLKNIPRAGKLVRCWKVSLPIGYVLSLYMTSDFPRDWLDKQIVYLFNEESCAYDAMVNFSQGDISTVHNIIKPRFFDISVKRYTPRLSGERQIPITHKSIWTVIISYHAVWVNTDAELSHQSSYIHFYFK